MRRAFPPISAPVVAAALILPVGAGAQSLHAPGGPLSEAAFELPAAPRSRVLFQGAAPGRDSLVDGMLIGAGIGAAVGMLVAPRAFCGANDTECATIVRVAIGLPAIAGGLGIGALVDALHKDRRVVGAALKVDW